GLAPLEFDHHPQTVLVRLVAQLADAFDFLFFDQLGDPLDHPRLVDLVGNFVDDDAFAMRLFVHQHFGPGPQVNAAAAGAVGLDDAGPAVDDGAGREVGTGNEFHQFIDGDVGVVQHRQTALDHFAQVVRR